MSSNVLFLWDNAADRGTVSASSEVAAMPATNLQGPQRSDVWRSSGASPQQIDITLDANELSPIGAIALVDCNISPAGTVKAQGWADGFGVGDTVSVEIEPWDVMYGYGVGGYGVGGYGGVADTKTQMLLRPIFFVPLGDWYDYRYWRITLTDTSLTYLQAARVYVGSIWQPSVNMNYGWKLGREPGSRFITSRGGQKYGNPRPGANYLDLSLDWLSDSDRDDLWLQYLALEDHSPFIVCAKPDGVIQRITTAMYATFDPVELTHTNYQTAATRLRIMEAL